MSVRIQELYDKVKPEPYTTLVIWKGHLYERYYPTFDKPDYTRVLPNLTEEEITFAESIGISNRDKW